jgi:long-chain acyl-CoA synthetase
MADGYTDDPDATGRAFRHGGFLMGDLGTFDEDGRLYLTGRKRRFIERAGFKVDPAEVEAALEGHPAVAEAVVLAAPADRPGEHAVKAVVVLSGPASSDELVGHCRRRLAPFKVPDEVEVRDALPRTPLGKVLRDRLR